MDNIFYDHETLILIDFGEYHYFKEEINPD